MGRPRSFDEDVVLERATRAFWEQGYEATSLADLEAATGLAKGSLYKAFEGKHDLFKKALERYVLGGRKRIKTALEDAPSGATGLERWLRAIADSATGGSVRIGCFAVNCTVERGPNDPEIRALLVENEKLTEGLYAAAIRRGMEEGDFRSDIDPVAAARYINGIIHGMQVLGKSSLDRDQAERMIQLALRALS